jgi:hypothetical protein
VTAGNGDGEAQALDEDIVESVGISIDNTVTVEDESVSQRLRRLRSTEILEKSVRTKGDGE